MPEIVIESERRERVSHNIALAVNQLIEIIVRLLYPACMPDADSPELILDAAEELFANHGFDATSVRAVTRHAGMNPAAVHYHFGSKQILVRALLERRIAPLNQERLLLLDHVLRDGEPELEGILDAYLRPVLRHSGAATGRLNSLLFNLPDDLRSELLDDPFGLLHRRFHAALRQALPDLSAGEVEERFRYSIAIMAHVASGEIDVYPSDAKSLPRRTKEDRLRSIIKFLSHGLRAPGTRAATS